MVIAKPACKAATVVVTVAPVASTYVMLVMSAASTVPKFKLTTISVACVLGLLCATVNTKVLLVVPSTAAGSVAVMETTGLSAKVSVGVLWPGALISVDGVRLSSS